LYIVIFLISLFRYKFRFTKPLLWFVVVRHQTKVQVKFSKYNPSKHVAAPLISLPRH